MASAEPAAAVEAGEEAADNVGEPRVEGRLLMPRGGGCGTSGGVAADALNAGDARASVSAGDAAAEALCACAACGLADRLPVVGCVVGREGAALLTTDSSVPSVDAWLLRLLSPLLLSSLWLPCSSPLSLLLLLLRCAASSSLSLLSL